MILIPSLVQILSRAVSLSCIELEAGKYICLIRRGIYWDMTKWIFVQPKMDCLWVKIGLARQLDGSQLGNYFKPWLGIAVSLIATY